MIPIVTFEVAIFLLVLYKTIEEYKSDGLVLQGSRLLQVLVRDSFAYFIM